jgi:hypothetical protein
MDEENNSTEEDAENPTPDLLPAGGTSKKSRPRHVRVVYNRGDSDPNLREVRCGGSKCTRQLVKYSGAFIMSMFMAVFCAYMLATKDPAATQPYLALLSTIVAVWVPHRVPDAPSGS